MNYLPYKYKNNVFKGIIIRCYGHKRQLFFFAISNFIIKRTLMFYGNLFEINKHNTYISTYIRIYTATKINYILSENRNRGQFLVYIYNNMLRCREKDFLLS